MEKSIDNILHAYGGWSVIFGFALLFGLTALSLLLKHPKKQVKVVLFISFVLVALVPTLFLSISTVYINTISSSNGPVHWHVDLEMWACGQQINLKDPKGWSNKIGTATLHEHNDNRIHLEGVVLKPSDASLGKFFAVIGGKLENSAMTAPANNGNMLVESGLSCGDNQNRVLQFFVYKTDTAGYYYQEKLKNPAAYIMSPYGNVPPGDCIIGELDYPKERTDKLCTSYEAAIKTGKIKERF